MEKFKTLRKEEIMLDWRVSNLSGSLTFEEFSLKDKSWSSWDLEPLPIKINGKDFRSFEDPFQVVCDNQKEIMETYISMEKDAETIGANESGSIERAIKNDVFNDVNYVLKYMAYPSIERYASKYLWDYRPEDTIIPLIDSGKLINAKAFMSALIHKTWFKETTSMNVVFPEVVKIGKNFVKIKIPSDKKGLFIGKKGANIKEIQKNLGKRVILL